MHWLTKKQSQNAYLHSSAPVPTGLSALPSDRLAHMPGMTRSSSFYGPGTRTCLSHRTCRTKPHIKWARKALADTCPRFGAAYFPITWSSMPQQLVLNSKKIKRAVTSQGLISVLMCCSDAGKSQQHQGESHTEKGRWEEDPRNVRQRGLRPQ